MRLKLEGVSAVYQPGTPFATVALSGVSLTVGAGERVGVIGPAGSGKSTLIELLAGVLTPAEGTVWHDGIPLGRRRPLAPGSIGLAFQEPENSLFAKTVFDDVAFGPRRLGLDEGEVRRRVSEALAAVGLDPGAAGARSPFTLSAGEQRRAALAGVFALKPAALLLDEPTARLDPVTARDIIGRLAARGRDEDVTLVVAGHDMDEMARLAGRVVVLDGGRIAADGPAREILADTGLLSRHGLEPPGTMKLSGLLSALTGAPAPVLLSEEEAVAALREIAGGAGGRGR